jgi:hypothetical protein
MNNNKQEVNPIPNDLDTFAPHPDDLAKQIIGKGGAVINGFR